MPELLQQYKDAFQPSVAKHQNRTLQTPRVSKDASKVLLTCMVYYPSCLCTVSASQLLFVRVPVVSPHLRGRVLQK